MVATVQTKAVMLCAKNILYEISVEALASQITVYEDVVVAKVALRKDMDYTVARNIKDY